MTDMKMTKIDCPFVLPISAAYYGLQIVDANEQLLATMTDPRITSRFLRTINNFEKMHEALKDARESVEVWASYASPFFREKGDLAGDLARIDAVLKEIEDD